MPQEVVRKRGGKWHRGGRFAYPGDVHCPTGLGLVILPRGTEWAWSDEVPAADMCRKCFGGGVA